MRSIRNKKGFTMTELLAAIVILGLLSAFAIGSISIILSRAEKNHYETQEKNMIMAAESYASDNQNVLPKDIGGTTVIKLSDLQDKKYIGEVLDRSKNVCTDGDVTIFRYSKEGYSYRPYLKCPKFETSKDVYGGTGPVINLSINTNYVTPSFSYEITNDDDGKIISYSYVIYKYGVLVRDSGSVPVSSASAIDMKEVSLKDLIPGEFEIVFTATNNYGYTTTKIESASIIDDKGPTCYNIQPVYTENDWRSYTNPAVITVNCKDDGGSGCAKEIFSQSFSEDTGTHYIEMIDNDGRVGNCEVGVYIDNTPPDKPILDNPYENTWINKSYKIKAISKDETSGIKYYEYRFPNSSAASEREWKQYQNSSRPPKDSTPFVTPSFSKERGEYVEIRACDYAGNCSEATASMIKIDKTVPGCTTSKSNLNTPDGVTVAVSCTENGTTISGVSACAGVSGVEASKTGVKSDKTYTVTDVAGNSNTCKVEVLNKTQYNKRTCAANRCPSAGCESGTQSYTTCGIENIQCRISATVGTGYRSSGGGSCSAVNGTWLNGAYYTNCTDAEDNLNDCICTKYSCSVSGFEYLPNAGGSGYCSKMYDVSWNDASHNCPVGERYSTGRLFMSGSEPIDRWCSTDTVPTGCTGTTGGEDGKYITACNCTQYYSDSSRCDCSSWNSWGSWSDSSSNYCTDSRTCDGSTRTVYY